MSSETEHPTRREFLQELKAFFQQLGKMGSLMVLLSILETLTGCHIDSRQETPAVSEIILAKVMNQDEFEKKFRQAKIYYLPAWQIAPPPDLEKNAISLNQQQIFFGGFLRQINQAGQVAYLQTIYHGPIAEIPQALQQLGQQQNFPTSQEEARFAFQALIVDCQAEQALLPANSLTVWETYQLNTEITPQQYLPKFLIHVASVVADRDQQLLIAVAIEDLRNFEPNKIALIQNITGMHVMLK